MFVKTTRNGIGAGTALATATSTERLSIGQYIYLQLLGTGPITVTLKFGSNAIHSPILLNDSVPGVLVSFPQQISAKGEALYVELSAGSIDVSVTVDVERLSY